MESGYFHIHEEVAEALEARRPVVALESTIISHGLPYPENVETAQKLEEAVRAEGAVPATIAMISGILKIGLRETDLETLATAKDIHKLNAADIPLCIAQGGHGGTTVAGTMFCAHRAGIEIFATGGIGGVHRGAGDSGDISQDLEALARYNVTVVSAGAKAILDLPRTLEYLETKAVPVVGYGTDDFPAFWTRHSGLKLHWRIDTADEAAQIMKTRKSLETAGGMLIANPVPEEQSLPAEQIDEMINKAVVEAAKQDIQGKALTPYLLERIRELSDGASLAPNITLAQNNAGLAAQIACAYSES